MISNKEENANGKKINDYYWSILYCCGTVVLSYDVINENTILNGNWIDQIVTYMISDSIS